MPPCTLYLLDLNKKAGFDGEIQADGTLMEADANLKNSFILKYDVGQSDPRLRYRLDQPAERQKVRVK